MKTEMTKSTTTGVVVSVRSDALVRSARARFLIDLPELLPTQRFTATGMHVAATTGTADVFGKPSSVLGTRAWGPPV